jgi:preprotein translocase subunit SecE
MATTRTTPAKFFQEVRQEVSKVTWPTRKETMITTAMVFVMVVLASLFFLAVDWGLGTIIDLLVFRRPGQ